MVLKILRVDWTDLAQGLFRWRVCVEAVLDIWVLQNENFLNPLNAELNPICYLLALLGAHHFLHVSRIRVKSLNFRLLMS